MATMDRLLDVMERSFRIAAKYGIPTDLDDLNHAIEFEVAFINAKMKGMTPQEAEAFSAQLVAEADEAMVKAEDALREAEAAEAEAEAAKAFAAAEMRRSRKRRRTHG